MFRYPFISISFFIIMFALIIQVQHQGYPWWTLIIPLVVYTALLVLGSVRIGMNFYFHSLSHADTTVKEIAITFDDGPNASVTPRLLDLLKKENTPATFFCIGHKMETHPEIVRDIHKQGHLTGNHSYSHHRWFDLFSKNKMADEIERTSNIIHKLTGKKPLLFRPPYGVTNPTLKKAVQQTGVIPVGWSLRSFDTVKSTQQVLNKLRSKTKPGSVVLFHDTDEKIIAIVEDYLVWLKEQGYKIVSLEQLFKINAYATD